jgi:hypothetical protein
MIILILLHMPGLSGSILQRRTVIVLPVSEEQTIAYRRLDSNFHRSFHTNVKRHDTVICELLISYQNILCGRRTYFEIIPLTFQV